MGAHQELVPRAHEGSLGQVYHQLQRHDHRRHHQVELRRQHELAADQQQVDPWRLVRIGVDALDRVGDVRDEPGEEIPMLTECLQNNSQKIISEI